MRHPLHSTPDWRTVLEQQVRSVGMAIRGAAAVAGVLAAAIIIFVGLGALRVGEGIPFVPEMAFLAAFAAPLLPIAVWRGEYDFRRSYIASMPVGLTRHVLTKIAAGWVWLMVMVAALMLLLFALALVTGGQVGVDEMRVLAGDLPSGAAPDEALAFARRWRTPGWQWVAFFTSATAIYLIGSAVVLAGNRVRRWLAGIAVGCFFVVIADDEVMHLGGVAERLEIILTMIAEGQYGLETLISGINEIGVLTTAGGERVTVMRSLPTLRPWLIATLLWTGLAAASVMAAVWGDRKG